MVEAERDQPDRVSVPGNTSGVIKAIESSKPKDTMPTQPLDKRPGQGHAAPQNATLETAGGAESSGSSLKKSNNHLSSRPANRQFEAAVAVVPNLSQTAPFMTSAKRKRLENETADVVITRSVTKAPKPTPAPTYNELEEENKALKKEIHQLRLARNKISSADKVISHFVASASIMETVVDVRETEMRQGLNSLSEAMHKIQDHLAEMIKFSNTTTDVVGGIPQSTVNKHLSRSEAGRLERLYENAKPGPEVAQVIHEKLTFTPKARGRPRNLT